MKILGLFSIRFFRKKCVEFLARELNVKESSLCRVEADFKQCNKSEEDTSPTRISISRFC